MVIVAYTCITSCSLSKNSDQDVAFYQLQAMPPSLQNKVFLETLTFEQEESRTLLTQIEINEQTLNLGAMTFAGLPIIQAKWHIEEGLVGFSSVAFDKNMALRIIRDIQLVKWPEENLQLGLLSGYKLDTTKESQTKWIRTISNSEKAFVKIIYTKNKIVLKNMIEHYQLTIEQVNE